MDAQVFARRTIRLSGGQLTAFLAIALVGIAALADGLSGRALGLTDTLMGPLLLCSVLAAAVGYSAVPLLRALKAGQVIRQDGPQSHLKKAGTPTMGGLFFLPVAIAAALLWTNFASEVLAVAAITLAYGFIGWVDDWAIIRGQSNKGMTPRMKLALQLVFGLLFCFWLAWSQSSAITTVALPFGWALPMGVLFWPLAVFTLTAESNAVNLTDGVDGLAGGTVAIALLALGIFIAPQHPELMVLCVCLSGSCLGFLAHNRHPAQVFMGNTGSSALGGALAAIALTGNALFPLLIVSGVFLVETLSVIAQVSYYKATKGPDGIGKRLFKMSPFHNHLELSGWTEIQIVAAFYLITGALGLLALLLH